MRVDALRHKFVEFIPSALADGVLYVSIPYATAVHNCCCGCGQKVVTPLTPTDWNLMFDGETVSLSPSVGNWSFRCQSHYWIQHDQVVWAPRLSREQIERGRRRDRAAKALWYRRTEEAAARENEPNEGIGLLRRLWRSVRRSLGPQ